METKVKKALLSLHDGFDVLKFSNSLGQERIKGELEENKSSHSMKELVYFILEETRVEPSYGILSGSFFQMCPEGRRRSAYDIWRHVKYFSPDVSIFEVMRTLWRMSMDHLITTSYCSTIERRTFRIEDNGWTQRVYSEDTVDEFLLGFDEWETIGGYR